MPLLAPPAAPNQHDAAEAPTVPTARRLGRAILGYLIGMTAIITLAPFRFAWPAVHGWTAMWNPADLVLNVLLFVPIGFMYRLTRPRGAESEGWRVILLGAALSLGIECAQLFAPLRYTSLLDVATNTLGATLGSWLFTHVGHYASSDATVHRLALELPLTGVAYLLIPLAWLVGLTSGGDVDRERLVLLLTIMAAIIVGTVHASHVAPTRDRREVWLAALPVGWVLVAVAPFARRDLWLGVEALAVVLAATLLRHRATGRRLRTGRSRRVERPTLRLLMPLFAVFVGLTALWPLTGPVQPWQATLALVLPDRALTDGAVYGVLEQVATFTLVGYLGAEYRGRDNRSLRTSLPPVLAWGAAVSVALQLARGAHAAHGASLLLLVFTVLATAFGAALYILQRDHVRALLGRG